MRLNFALKLNKGLMTLRLPLEYMSIFSLAANDPLKERRAQIKNFLHANISKRRDYIKQNPSIGGMCSFTFQVKISAGVWFFLHNAKFVKIR